MSDETSAPDRIALPPVISGLGQGRWFVLFELPDPPREPERMISMNNVAYQQINLLTTHRVLRFDPDMPKPPKFIETSGAREASNIRV